MRGISKYLILCLCIQLAIESDAQRRKGKDRTSQTDVQSSEYYFTEGEKFFILENYAKSMAYFQKAIEADPGNSAAYYKKGQIELENENYQAAMRDAEMAISLSPDNKYYYLLKISILTEQGNLRDAALTYEEMLASTETSANYLFELAALYLYDQEFEKALETYDRLEQHFGFDENIALQRHKIYVQINDSRNALRELEELHERFPLEARYVVTLAEYLIQLEREEEALGYLTDFLDKVGDSGRVQILAGEIHRKEKEYAAAAPYLKSAFSNPQLDPQIKIQLIAQYRTIERSREFSELVNQLSELLIANHPDEPNAHSVYGDFLQHSGYPELAAEQYKRSVELDPSNFAVWQNLMLINSSLGNYGEVVEITDKALAYFPNQSIIYYLSGFAHIRNKNYQEAIYILQTGRKLAGTNTEIMTDFNSLLGEAYNGAGDYDKSDAAFEAVLENDPLNYIVLNNYSYYLAIRNERLEEAEKMSTKLVKDNPNDPTFLDTHAWVLYQRGKYREARKFMERAIEYGARATHYDHYGDILFKLGKTDEAVEQWEKAREMDPKIRMIDKKIEERRINE